MKINVLLNTLSQPGSWGIIRVQGGDAVKFLQGQLTQDVALMGLGQARLAAWCSAKGRILASFVMVKNTHEDILLLCSADLLATTLKRLGMFVLRAQCKLSDATAAYQLHGLAGDAIKNAAAYASNMDFSALKVDINGEELTVQLPPGYHAGRAIPRALQLRPALCPDPSTQPVVLALQADDAALQDWLYLEVTSGIARVSAPVADAFVPQMLNYESVGGVNFKKGCYPGQEVVARSQFRGTLKRRAYVVQCAAPLVAGMEVFAAGDAQQPCGTVVQAAVTPQEREWQNENNPPDIGYTAIVSMQISAAQGAAQCTADSTGLAGSLHAGSASGAVVQVQKLPYELLADI